MTVEQNIRRLLRSPFPDIRGEYTPVPPVYQPQAYEVQPADAAGISPSTVAAARAVAGQQPVAPAPAGAAPPSPAADELALPDPSSPTRADFRQQEFGARDSVDDDPMDVTARQRAQMTNTQGPAVDPNEPPEMRAPNPYADLRDKAESKKRAKETAARTAIAMQGLGVLTDRKMERHAKEGFAGKPVTPAEQLEFLYNQHRTNVPGFAEEYPSFEAYVAGAFGGGSAGDVANRIDQHLSAIEQGPKFPGRTGQGGQGVAEQPRMPMGRRERSTTGVPLEGTDPKEWDKDTRRKRGRDIFNPDAQTTPTGGTFTVNPNGSMSMRGVNAESYKVYDDYRRNFGENDERTVMAGAAAVGIDPQKYGDDMVSLAADVQRRMREVERYQGRFERTGKVDENGVPIRTRTGGSTYRTQAPRIAPDGTPVMRQKIGPDGKPVMVQQVDAEGKPVVDENGQPVMGPQMVPVQRSVTRHDGAPMWRPEEQVDGSARLVQTEEGRQYNDDQRAKVLAGQVWQRWGWKMAQNGMTQSDLEQIAAEEGPAGLAKINKAYWDDRMANSRGQLAAQNAQRSLMLRMNQGYGPAIVSNQIATAQTPQEMAAALWLGNLMNQGAARRQEVMVPGGRFIAEQVPQGTTGMDVMGGVIGNMQQAPEPATGQTRIQQIQSLPPQARKVALMEHYQSPAGGGLPPAEAEKAAETMLKAMEQADPQPQRPASWFNLNPFSWFSGTERPAGGVSVAASPQRPRMLSNLV